MITKYEDLNLRKWGEIKEIVEDEGRDDLGKQVAIMGVLCDESEGEIEQLPILEYKQRVGQMEFLNESPRGEMKLKKSVKIGERDCEIFNDIQKMNVAQYVDFQQLVKGGDKNASKLLSVFIIPKGKRYNTGYDIGELQEDISEFCSVEFYNSFVAFFLQSLKSLTEGIIFCLGIMTKKSMSEEVKELKNIIAGFSQLMQLQSLFGVRGIEFGR